MMRLPNEPRWPAAIPGPFSIGIGSSLTYNYSMVGLNDPKPLPAFQVNLRRRCTRVFDHKSTCI